MLESQHNDSEVIKTEFHTLEVLCGCMFFKSFVLACSAKYWNLLILSSFHSQLYSELWIRHTCTHTCTWTPVHTGTHTKNYFLEEKYWVVHRFSDCWEIGALKCTWYLQAKIICHINFHRQINQDDSFILFPRSHTI